MKLPPITINNDSKYYPDQVARMMREYAAAAIEGATKELRAELAELLEHEKQTHERLGKILGTDDSLEECAKRLRAERDALRGLLDDVAKGLRRWQDRRPSMSIPVQKDDADVLLAAIDAARKGER
jgi:hypothetical protein